MRIATPKIPQSMVWWIRGARGGTVPVVVCCKHRAVRRDALELVLSWDRAEAEARAIRVPSESSNSSVTSSQQVQHCATQYLLLPGCLLEFVLKVVAYAPCNLTPPQNACWKWRSERRVPERNRRKTTVLLKPVLEQPARNESGRKTTHTHTIAAAGRPLARIRIQRCHTSFAFISALKCFVLVARHHTLRTTGVVGAIRSFARSLARC